MSKRKGRPPTQAKVVVYKGEHRELPELCRSVNIRPSTVRSRLGRGWSVERAVDTPVDTRRSFPVTQSRGINAGRNLGIRTRFASNLFELFNKYGQQALEQAIKEQASNPETVLDFVEKYLMKLLPKGENQTLDAPSQKSIITIDVRTDRPAPVVIDQPAKEQIEHKST